MSFPPRLNSIVARLLVLNERYRTLRVRSALTLGVWIAAVAALVCASARNPGLDAPPSIGGDAVSYDSLGWELAAGRGFALNLRDAEFIEPYAQVDPTAAERLAAARAHGTIASRPPLLPLLLSGLNRACGRQFWGLRLVNAAALGTVAAMLAWTVCRLAGPVPTLLAVFQFLVVDPRVRITAREILTEGLACLLIAVLAVVLVRLVNRPRLRTALLAGGIIGLAMLLRTMFVIWIPVVAIAIWLTPRDPRQRNTASSLSVCESETREGDAPAEPHGRVDAHRGSARQEPRPPSATPPKEQEQTTAPRSALLATFIIAACIVFAPWGVRNCMVLGRLLPLGTQGTIELSAGYSDAAFERWGMWHNLEETGFFAEIDRADQTELERELARAGHSRRQAVAWCRAHPFKAALLPLMKVFQEFRPHMSGDLFALAFALLGLAFVRGTPEGRAWGTILAATAVGVALTWSVAGRFIVPMLFVLHCAAAIGVWNSLIACTLGRREPDEYNRCLIPITDNR